jgi:hypothetical protein
MASSLHGAVAGVQPPAASDDGAPSGIHEPSRAARAEEVTMADRELLEWLFYAAIGLCALGVHSMLTAMR